VISSELLTDLLAPAGEGPIEPMAQARLQALVDAVPVALMEFRLQRGRLLLLAANAAARRMPGLGAVRHPGADASEVFDLLEGTALLDQLHGVVRVGAPLECRQVVREPGRLLLAWDLSARRVTNDCIVVTVRDATEAETLRSALAASERALEEVRRASRPRSSTPWRAWRAPATGAASKTRARRCCCGLRGCARSRVSISRNGWTRSAP
jgi:PAS domain-containing protein